LHASFKVKRSKSGLQTGGGIPCRPKPVATLLVSLLILLVILLLISCTVVRRSVSRISHDRSNGRRSNMVCMGKG